MEVHDNEDVMDGGTCYIGVLPVSVARRLLPLQEGWLQTFSVSDGASRLTKVTLSWTSAFANPVMVQTQEIFPG